MNALLQEKIKQNGLLCFATFRPENIAWIEFCGCYNLPIFDNSKEARAICHKITHIALYQKTRGGEPKLYKIFSAKFLKEISRGRLIKEYPEYPSRDEKSHAQNYFLFKVELIDDDCEGVLAKLKAAGMPSIIYLKGFVPAKKEFEKTRKNLSAETTLGEIFSKIKPAKLYKQTSAPVAFVSETVQQLAFWDKLGAPTHETKKRKQLFASTVKKTQIRFIDLFAGIGGIRLPFEEMGYKCVFSSEWDKFACETYAANFGDVPHGDITKIAAEDIPGHDLLLAGFPCQAFSICGKQLGFADTRGTMFFEIERILQYHHPKAFLLENVKQLVSHDHGNTFAVIQDRLMRLGYHFKWKILNALDFGVPQKRERVLIVGFLDKAYCDRFSFDFEKTPYDLKSILESEEKVDSSLFASKLILGKRRERIKNKRVFYPSIWHENKAGNISVLDYACALRTGASYNYLLVNGIRRPSSRELLRFQGFPDTYKIVVPHAEIRRQTGNSVAVPMIRAVAKRIDAIINL